MAAILATGLGRPFFIICRAVINQGYRSIYAAIILSIIGLSLAIFTRK
ncbi:hypothetical protein amyaer_3733 [Microcystis aeruginosa NIES-2481]|nr:hypothetical protein amyaer_3733 [Microcystis aeruginosa NIES-2481]